MNKKNSKSISLEKLSHVYYFGWGGVAVLALFYLVSLLLFGVPDKPETIAKNADFPRWGLETTGSVDPSPSWTDKRQTAALNTRKKPGEKTP